MVSQPLSTGPSWPTPKPLMASQAPVRTEQGKAGRMRLSRQLPSSDSEAGGGVGSSGTPRREGSTRAGAWPSAGLFPGANLSHTLPHHRQALSPLPQGPDSFPGRRKVLQSLREGGAAQGPVGTISSSVQQQLAYERRPEPPGYGPGRRDTESSWRLGTGWGWESGGAPATHIPWVWGAHQFLPSSRPPSPLCLSGHPQGWQGVPTGLPHCLLGDSKPLKIQEQEPWRGSLSNVLLHGDGVHDPRLLWGWGDWSQVTGAPDFVSDALQLSSGRFLLLLAGKNQTLHTAVFPLPVLSWALWHSRVPGFRTHVPVLWHQLTHFLAGQSL